ncbi:MAG: glycosyltransferase [Paraprevotella sp.]|nr:glycosyltransferase [Paraprevotella sp.]
MKFSIVTTTYNSVATIRSTVESVAAQVFDGEVEYIVIDGGSTDGSLELLARYAKVVNVLVSEPDKGLYDAMNKGIRLATGDVVGILNSDDFYTSDDVLATIAEEFGRKEVDAVFGDIHFVNPDNLGKCVRYYSSRIFTPKMLRFGFMPAHPSFYVRRECYARYGGYDLSYRIASDYDLMVRFFYKYKISYSYIQKDMVTMRTGGLSSKNLKHRLLITTEDVKACRKYGLYSNWFFMSLKYVYKVFEIRFFCLW